MDDADRQKLQHFMVRAATISSVMGAYTQSRVQFEGRDDKREALGDAPTVDMDDPTGTHIGQWALAGAGVTSLRDGIREAFAHPEQFGLDYQDDADNFAAFTVELPLEDAWTRDRIAEATRRGLSDRSLRLTRHAVSVMQAFCGSIHDVAKALFYLPSEDGRLVRVDDLKYALSRLPSTRIFPSAPGSTKSKVVHTLIQSSMPLPQGELCDRAGVSEASFAGYGDAIAHRDELEAFGIIRETGAGWVVCLTYREVDFSETPDEETPDALPWYAVLDDGESHRDRRRDRDMSEDSLRGALYDAMLVLESVAAFADPDHAVVGTTYGPLTDTDVLAIIDERPSWTPLVETACALRERDPPSTIADTRDERVRSEGYSVLARLGRSPEQAGMGTFDAADAALADD